ncbi:MULTISPECIES: (Fe-S)-binding protein [Malaciobacter]|jgi:L-lactate dehydrogenase complex protein LldE|uniref:L-lactate dehydrogenase complex protein LldE n=2 Tax=Malaciobacter TaxID=2321114 RepID=A0AB36ZVG6_9BACT|nr:MULTISPECIES: (Fe-S)-binding protein [Malaciobacter]PHO09543.1 Fe-S oxidoreductase [Malaciobacter canalis]PPK61391.1 L-lactate dehydrogenase complex protein LldE [Malaciobacter marinus]QEE31608.1 L-lactate utilization protein LutA [Malaciobacter canalis]SKB45836.1 L-lactate dehydrogenase complex protein LldE [Malaciobacter marinus]
MKIGLFIPCFMNELYPDICMATLKILKDQNLDVDYPMSQTCCGQPMANSGCSKDVETLAKQFVENFKDYDYIVAPSGSCVSMVKEHYAPFFENSSDYNKVKTSIYEICEFLHDILKVEKFDVSFPHKVGIHNSCHGHRMLKLGSASELNIPYQSKLKNLLSLVKDIEIVSLKRDDECCGFGGTFCVTEEDISVAMGKDRIKDHLDSHAKVITGADMSCLMHMDGIINRDNENIKVMHIVEILAGVKYE